MSQVQRNKSASRVRIIGGQWRSRMLGFPEISGLRPTPDRVRETLFNWLGQTLDGKVCLDLFSGSGGLGFEALSRYARQVVMVETDPAALVALRSNAAALSAAAEIVASDAMGFLQRDKRLFDVIFLDPPFRQGWFDRLLPAVLPHLAQDGLLYLESEYSLTPPEPFSVYRSGKAGQVHYALWQRA